MKWSRSIGPLQTKASRRWCSRTSAQGERLPCTGKAPSQSLAGCLQKRSEPQPVRTTCIKQRTGPKNAADIFLTPHKVLCKTVPLACEVVQAVAASDVVAWRVLNQTLPAGLCQGATRRLEATSFNSCGSSASRHELGMLPFWTNPAGAQPGD